jgi:hypothetical protein
VKSLSLSLIIYYNIPCYITTYRLKMYVRFYTVAFSLYSMKYPYFVNLSVTTKIESYLILILGLIETGNLVIKSIATFYYTPADAAFTFNFHRVYILSTYSFDKSYISVFSPLYIFSFLKSSRFVRFVPKYNRFLNSSPFKDYNFKNKSLFVRIGEYRFVHL